MANMPPDIAPDKSDDFIRVADKPPGICRICRKLYRASDNGKAPVFGLCWECYESQMEKLKSELLR